MAVHVVKRSEISREHIRHRTDDEVIWGGWGEKLTNWLNTETLVGLISHTKS